VGAQGARVRRPAVTAVLAVVALAALVAVAVTRDAGPPVIRLGAAGAGVAQDATMEMADDAMMSRAAWVEYRFVLGDGARFAAGDATGWRLEPPADPRGAALALARTLGIDADEVTSPWGDGSYQVGPDDGSGPTLWVGPHGDWNYHDPSSEPRIVCAEPSAPEGEPIPVEPDEGIGDGVAVDDLPAREELLIDEVCEPLEPVAGVPDEAAARQAAARFFATLELPGTPTITDAYADDWNAWVGGRVPLGEVDSDLHVSVSFGGDGIVTSASGTLARPVEAGTYPTIDAEAAVARLEAGQAWGGAVAEPQIDVAVDEPGDAPAGDAATSDLVDPDTPVEAPAERSGGPAGEDDGEDDGEMSILPTYPEPEGEPQEVTVTLVSAEQAALFTVDQDGTIWLLPGVRFRSDDGGEWQVLLVADEYLDADAADDGDGTEPGTEEPAPAPEPIPDPGTEPGTGGGVSGEPGTGEPIDPGTAPGSAPDEPDTGPAEEVARQVVGMGEADAIATIEAEGFVHRVVRHDDEWYAVTDDWRTDRINLEVEDGTVVASSVG
jgi:hypothetical protein